MFFHSHVWNPSRVVPSSRFTRTALQIHLESLVALENTKTSPRKSDTGCDCNRPPKCTGCCWDASCTRVLDPCEHASYDPQSQNLLPWFGFCNNFCRGASFNSLRFNPIPVQVSREAASIDVHRNKIQLSCINLAQVSDSTSCSLEPERWSPHSGSSTPTIWTLNHKLVL